MVLGACVSLPAPEPYVEEILKDLKKSTAEFYDGIMVTQSGATACQFSESGKFWADSERKLAILRYRIAERASDAILVDPIAKLSAAYTAYKNAQRTAEQYPAPNAGPGQNPKCLPANIAAQNSISLESEIDHLVTLQQKRKDASK